MSNVNLDCFVNVEIKDYEDRWEILLRRSSTPSLTNTKLRKIRSILLRMDNILRTKLLLDQDVVRVLSKSRSSTTDQRSISVIRPLLSKVADRGKPYQFQRDGVAWLLRKKRGILADEMGLGKTIQAIIALRKLTEGARVEQTLVICPRGLTDNWMAELQTWAPNLVISRLTVKERASSDVRYRKANVFLTTYENFRARHVETGKFDLVICDEAHRLRKADSLLYKRFKECTSERIWFLTGTPIERSKSDLLTLLSLLEPSKFSPNTETIHQTSLKSRARPFLLRRTKEEVLKELPSVFERLIELVPSRSQKEHYRRVMLDPTITTALTRFNLTRAICDLTPNEAYSPKVLESVKIIRAAHQRNDKIVVFSFTLDPLRSLGRALLEAKINFVTIEGSLNLDERTRILKTFKSSTKANVLLASSKIASEGLTLIEANHVIFLNKWWNPSSNRQARDRIIRIGQKKTCYVYSFVMLGTIEERLERMLATKQEVFDQIMLKISEHEAVDFYDEPNYLWHTKHAPLPSSSS